MTSMQTNTKQLNVDKWSTREQLCLVSAVSDNSEHNWDAISCSLKALCDATSESRPGDWFSQKNCAVQYEKLLEEVTDRACSSSAAKCPAQIMLRNLTEERVQELRTNIKKEQKEYAKLYTEIRALQSNCLSNEQLLQMWLDIEKEQEMQRIEEMTLENRLREREEKKNELKKAWHPTAIILHPHSLPQLGPIKSLAGTNNAVTKLDAENILSFSKTNSFNTSSNEISPLLSSLLKSNQHIGHNNNGASSGNASSIRTSAPTITTLLTGGSVASTNLPAIIPSHDNAIQLLARPITGPPLENVSTTQNVLSASQSAPTISMLLEKTKSTTSNTGSGVITPNQPEPNVTTKNVTDNSAPSRDVNNELIPMDIEEDVVPTNICERALSALTVSDDNSNDNNNSNDTNGSNINDNGNIDKTGPNEEQQLLEVFKNIGNIKELDIADVVAVINGEEEKVKEKEVNLRKAVTVVEDEKSTNEAENSFKTVSVLTEFVVNNNSATKVKIIEEETKKKETKHNINVVQPQIIQIAKNTTPVSNGSKNEIEEKSINKKGTAVKVEIISSDDSNDNLPLSTVATIKSVTKECTSNTNIRTNMSEIYKNPPLVKIDNVTYMKNETKQETEVNNAANNNGGSSDAEVVEYLNGDGNSSLKNEILEADKGIPVVDMTEIKDCNEVPTTENCKETPSIVDENSESKENFDATIVQSSSLKDSLEKENNEDKNLSKEKNEDSENDKITIPIEHTTNENKVGSKVMKCVKTLSENGKDIPVQHNVEEKPIIITIIGNQEAESLENETKVNVKKLVSTPIISVADTDEDSSTTDASTNTRKDEKACSTVLKLTRRSGSDVKKADNMPIPPPTSMVTPTSTVPNTQAMARSSTLRKLRERDRSESPMIDDDNNITYISDQTTSQRLRRRYSTPINDGIPNSPASSDRDERELRPSKKSLLSIYNILNSNKYAVMLQRLLNEESFTSKLEKICLSRMDLHTIKKNIESGQIRTTHELQRDILLMCQNAQMIVGKNSTNYKIILAFQHKCESIREFIRSNIKLPHNDSYQDKKINKANATSSTLGTTSRSRSGSRKSLRIS